MLRENPDSKTTGKLKEDDYLGTVHYCALGWLCVACQDVTGKGEFDNHGLSFDTSSGHYKAIISPEIMSEMTFRPVKMPELARFVNDIYTKNDGGISFGEIADYAEETYGE